MPHKPHKPLVPGRASPTIAAMARCAIFSFHAIGRAPAGMELFEDTGEHAALSGNAAMHHDQLSSPLPGRVRPCARAFTLIEILIVVVILGIIAAIVIIQVQNVVQDAATASLRTNLQELRDGIQRYRAEHASNPTITRFPLQMTQYTDAANNVSATPSSTYCFGPYLSAMPALPVGQQSGNTKTTNINDAPGFGWVYDPALGTIRSNTTAAELDSSGTPYRDY